ncbi:MAG: hypothetical protein IPL39_13255 [Opitutaceae bacterium]|nr:hypothetical protein [Opitutaceae bacterium]
MTPGPNFRAQALLSFPFFGLGLVALLALVAWAVVNPGLLDAPARASGPLAFVHLAVLGWMVPFVFGAAYQLIPVIAEAPLWSRRGAWLHFALHLVAAPLLIHAMARGDFAVASLWGGLVALGVVVGIADLAITADRHSRWTPENVGLVLALFWLAIAVGMGALLALVLAGRLHGFNSARLLPLHLTCGLVGFFLGTLFAVSFKLVPMFLLGRPGGRLRQWLVLGLLNAGLFLLVPGLLGDHRPLLLLGAATLAGAIVCFLDESVALFRRRLRAPDWPMRTFFMGIAMLIPATATGLAALLGIEAHWLPARPGAAMFTLLVFGVLTPCILGMAGKIVPFLAWQWRYSAHIGRARVPLVTDLFLPALLRIQFIVAVPACLALVAGAWLDSGLLLRCAAGGLFVAALTLALNSANLVPHLLHPRLQPLNTPDRTTTPRAEETPRP